MDRNRAGRVLTSARWREETDGGIVSITTLPSVALVWVQSGSRGRLRRDFLFLAERKGLSVREVQGTRADPLDVASAMQREGSDPCDKRRLDAGAAVTAYEVGGEPLAVAELLEYRGVVASEMVTNARVPFRGMGSGAQKRPARHPNERPPAVALDGPRFRLVPVGDGAPYRAVASGQRCACRAGGVSLEGGDFVDVESNRVLCAFAPAGSTVRVGILSYRVAAD